jgi:hypothetical protein
VDVTLAAVEAVLLGKQFVSKGHNCRKISIALIEGFWGFERYQPGVQVADFRQVGRRSRLRDLTKHLATDAEILRSHF